MDENVLLKFIQLTKADEATHTVYGIASSEKVDSDNEICDYESAKAEYTAWSNEQLAKTTAAGQDPSLGNIRIQHNVLQIGGKVTKLDFKDAQNQTWLESQPVNDEVWKMLKGGFLTGYSQGGSYKWRKCNTCGGEMPRQAGQNFCRKCNETVVVRFGPKIAEVSYVDRAAVPNAAFAYVRADGSIEMRKFQKYENTISNLSDTDIEKITKALESELVKGRSELDTRLKEFSALAAGLMAQQSAIGATEMNKEQIAACAKALGITEEEFTKQFVEGDALEKGKKGLAALHSHLQKAQKHHQMMVSHHAKIAEMHKAHGEHHATMADHMENCMKAHGACMDGAEAEKVLKALGVAQESIRSTNTSIGISEDQMNKAIADAVKKALDAIPAKQEARLFAVPRLSEEELAKTRKTGTDDAPVNPYGS